MKFALRVVAFFAAVLLFAGFVIYHYPLWVQDQGIRFHLWRSGVRSEYIDAGGYRIHYLEALPPKGVAGTPLLLVHGLGARAEDWAAMMPALAAQGFHVYALDLLGYGRSAKPDVSYSISMEETIVVQFMQAVHLSRADVGGWSMGGWVSMKLALDHPELVDRLIVYDSAGIYFPATFGPELFTPDDVAGVRKLIATLTPNKVVVPDFAAKAMARKLQKNAWVVQRSLASMVSGVDLLDFRLHGIQEPTLIVWGAEDALIPLPVGETLHEGIPNSVMDVIEGCGHLAPAECSKPVLQGTLEFLKAQPPMQGGGRTFPVTH
jgi:pimeloyl-ACP methyl ester carboxylesterase